MRNSRITAIAKTTGLILVIVIAVIVVAIGSFYFLSNPSNKPVTNISVGVLETTDVVPFLVALNEGYFNQHGLNVTYHFMAGGPVIAPAVSQGSIQIGENAILPLMSEVEQGFPFEFFAPTDSLQYPASSSLTSYVPGISTNAVIVLNSSGIHSWKDLSGKTIGTNAIGSITYWELIQDLALHGINASSVHIVAVSPPSGLSALEQNRVAAYTFLEPWVTVAKLANESGSTAGEFRILGDTAHVSPGWLVSAFFSTSSWINAHPTEVKAFVQAMTQGVNALAKNSSLGVQVLVKYEGLNQTVAQNVVLFSYPTGSIPYSFVQSQIQLGLTLGALKHQTDNATQIVDQTYMPLTNAP